MGSVGGEKYGFGIKWMNCGALMNQFFGNKKTLLFVRERDMICNMFRYFSNYACLLNSI
jgi:hypothetical protein